MAYNSSYVTADIKPVVIDGIAISFIEVVGFVGLIVLLVILGFIFKKLSGLTKLLK